MGRDALPATQNLRRDSLCGGQQNTLLGRAEACEGGRRSERG